MSFLRMWTKQFIAASRIWLLSLWKLHRIWHVPIGYHGGSETDELKWRSCLFFFLFCPKWPSEKRDIISLAPLLCIFIDHFISFLSLFFSILLYLSKRSAQCTHWPSSGLCHIWQPSMLFTRLLFSQCAFQSLEIMAVLNFL